MPHVQQSHPAVGGPGVGEPLAVVRDLHAAVPPHHGEADPGPAGAGVAADVGERLAQGGEQLVGDGVGHGRVHGPRELDRHVEADHRLQLLGQGEHMGPDAATVSGPTELEDGGPHLADGLVDVGDGGVEGGAHGPAGRGGGQALQRQPDGEEPLDDAVVQVPGQPVAVLVHRDLAGALVEPGVLHGDAGGDGQGLDDHLVVPGELVGADLVRQVQVAVDAVPDPDGRAEERGHGRVPGGEPRAGGVVGDHPDADRAGVGHEHAEDPLAGGEGPLQEPPLVLGVESGGQEVDGGAAPLVQHAEGPVPGAGQ